MFDSANGKRLAARKRLLVLESEMNRQALLLEFDQLRTSVDSSVGRVTSAVKSGQNYARLLLLAAPLAGLVFSRRKTGWGLLMKGATSAWNLFKRVQGLRHSHNGKAESSKLSGKLAEKMSGILAGRK